MTPMLHLDMWRIGVDGLHLIYLNYFKHLVPVSFSIHAMRIFLSASRSWYERLLEVCRLLLL